MAQSVEHVIGNDEVISSILITSSKIHRNSDGFFAFLDNPPNLCYHSYRKAVNL